MKKLFSYILIFLLLLLAATACGKPERTKTVTPSQTREASDTTLRAEAAQENKLRTETAVTATPNPETAKTTNSTEAETQSENQTQNSQAVSDTSDTRVTIYSDDSSSEISPSPEQTASPDASSVPPASTSDTTPETAAPSIGITVSKDGTITVGRDTVAQILEEEKELVAALGFSEEELETLIGDGDLVITSDMQEKLLDYLNSLSWTEQLRVLAKLTELMED